MSGRTVDKDQKPKVKRQIQDTISGLVLKVCNWDVKLGVNTKRQARVQEAKLGSQKRQADVKNCSGRVRK